MALNAKAGQFQRPAASTTDTVVASPGFRPGVVFFLDAQATAEATWTAAMNTIVSGVAPIPGTDGSTAATVRHFSGGMAGNDSAASPGFKARATDFLGGINPTGLTAWRSDVYFDSSGFTLDYSATNYDGVQARMNWLALGGDAKAVSFRTDGEIAADLLATGQSFTVPFFAGNVGVPNALVIQASTHGTGIQVGSGDYCLGFVDSYGKNVALSFVERFTDPTDAKRRSCDDLAVVFLDESTGAVQFAAKVIGWNAEGITFEVVTAASGIGSYPVRISGVGISGVTAQAGWLDKPTGAAPASQTVTVKGRPKAGLLMTASQTSLNSTSDHIRIGVGCFAYDGSGYQDGSIAGQWEDNAGTSNSDSFISSTRALTIIDNTTPATDAQADLTSTATGQINFSWSPNNGTAYKVAYLTFFETTSLSGAATISVGPTVDFARLAEAHPLTGRATISIGNPNQPAWLGSSSIGTHLLTGNASISIGGPAVPLRLNHGGKLTGAASISVTTGHTWPVQSHPLTGAASISITAQDALLGSAAAILSGSALIEVSTAAHLRTGARLTGNALIALTTDSLGLGGADLPIPTTLRDIDLVGTVNVFRNPSFELSTTDAAALVSATLSISSAQAWHGTSSLAVALANSANSGVRLTSQRGLPYSGTGHGFLAQVRLRGTVTGGVTLQSTIVYSDASTAAGPTVSAAPNGSGWTTAYVPVVESTANKQIDYVRLDITRAGATAGETLYVDGVQIELDRGHGHTAWAIGTFGSPYFRWQGGAHFSITIRDAIPADDTPVGTGGVYRLAPALWKVDANNIFLEDLSAYVVNGSVTFDPERDVSWQLNCTLTGDGWKRLEPWKDWLVPRLAVTLPDGTIREGQLGHFVVLPSPQEIHEGWRTVDVDARSGEFLLSIQGTKGIMTVRENTQYDRAVRVVLDNCHLGTDGVRPRYAIPNTNARTHRFMSWEKKEDALTIVNDLLRKDGLEPLYATKTGVLTSQRRKDRRYKHMEPVRVYAANLPDETVISPWVGRRIVSQNEVIDAIQTAPDLGRIDDNKIVVVSVNPRKPRIRAVRYINDPDNPISTRKRKRIRERKIEMDVGTNADAEKLAEAIADEISSDLETVTLAVIPDPQTEFARQVVFLAIYDAHGEPAAVGRFKVKTVTYGFTPDEAAMQLTLGFVNPVEQLDAFDATGYDVDGVWEWE